MSNNAHELSNRLLNALDNNYNVVDMHTVNEIISILEKFNITKELLETTRLGKHVNELRRKTNDPSLARRAKVLVKRWRDLVIPTVASPGHTGSNRSSAERTVRRLGGTPLTSPALSRVVSPAVNSPRTVSRPAWGGYESDSNDVILVDDDPPPAPPPAPLPALHKPITPPVKRPPSPEPLYDEKKAKRDKKPKKKRGHSRAGSGTEATPAPAPAPGGWRDRNGTAERRRNGCRKDALDPYTALVNKMPPAGAKKVKTTKELLEQIQSRGSRGGASPDESPAGSPASPDVMLIEPPSPAKAESPLRNGGASPPAESVAEPGEAWWEREEVCACGEQAEPACPLGAARRVRPRHVRALHAALLPGLNGTLAPPLPHRFAARATPHPERPDLFASVVPLYKYSDYTDDRLVKNMSGVPLCVHLPQDEFAPPPPSPPPAPPPPSPRPYPLDDDATDAESDAEPDRLQPPVKAEPMELEAPAEPAPAPPEPSHPAPADSQPPAHRTVERTKAPPSPSPSPPSPLDGAALVAACRRAVAAAPFDYSQLAEAPLAPADDALDAALAAAAASTRRDALARPLAPELFAEWHECARLGDLIALPYVVID